MNPDVTQFTIASRLASPSDCPGFVCSCRFLEMAARHWGKLSAPSMSNPNCLRLQARLEQFNCHQLPTLTQQSREQPIQYP
jgi:hypothetical protein